MEVILEMGYVENSSGITDASINRIQEMEKRIPGIEETLEEIETLGKKC